MPQTVPPTLILLPGGLCVSGVALWATRLASELALMGGHISLALFAHSDPDKQFQLPLDERVKRIDLTHLPPIESCSGDLSPYLPAIRDEISQLAAFGTVAILPNQHGDCFGIAAALAQLLGDRVRIIGTAHSDNAYDLRLLTHYAPMLSRMVAVSDTLEAKLRSALPSRLDDIAQIPYGVPTPTTPVERTPTTDRALRLLYAGRYEHRQKRVMALPLLAKRLEEAGIEFEMTLAGDGPARAELAEACKWMPKVRVLGPQSQRELAALFDKHDAMVLPSRFEGLSIAMLEAMAHGCVPIVTRCDSGSDQAIQNERNGLVADVSPDADEQGASQGLLDCVRRLLELDLSALSANASRRARFCFNLEDHAGAWSELLDGAAHANPRWWPASKPAAFSASSGGASGSVPEGGWDTMRRTLAALAGRAIVIHGGGRHTIDLAPLLVGADVRAIVDDDPARFGEKLLGWKIIGPCEAARTGATDVVISSSMHEEAIWNRRLIYEEQGLAVHRLYHAAGIEAKPSHVASSTRP